MLKLKIDKEKGDVIPVAVCAISGVEIKDAGHANIFWVFKKSADYFDSEIIDGPIIALKERSAKQVIDKHFGIEGDPDVRTQFMQLDEYLQRLWSKMGSLGREPDLAWSEYE